jgi:hypothetical protein
VEPRLQNLTLDVPNSANVEAYNLLCNRFDRFGSLHREEWEKWMMQVDAENSLKLPKESTPELF